MANAVHSAFKQIQERPIDTLNLVAQEYEHIGTGARHIHLQTENDENVFMVALRTVPQDSSGVAHILEHTVLCGSEHYPVRDPFFMMIRRSLNTFMNAFTSSDWTAYPFASQNRKDFNNLLDVYLDAVFFSNLNELDFLQEGHRVEFSQENDKNSELVYKGVVYNEMKGAMSSPASQLWQTLTKYLYPTTTYHFNSGGEPEHIPDLSYAALQAFYQTHYHPTNAVFMTFGDISAFEHQQKFQQQVLRHFERLPHTISVPNEKRYFAPLRVQEYYALSEADASKKNHVVMGWLLGSSIDLEQLLTAKLISNILLDNSASPLLHALETTDLGSAPSPLCGLEDSNREMCFVCGLEGTAAEDADKIEALILDILNRVAEEGVPIEQVEAVLHQLELSQREVGGGSYPYGLQLALTALPTAIHRGDVFSSLDVAPAIVRLRQHIQDPQFVKDAVRQLFLHNSHRVRLLLSPDAELNHRKQDAEKQMLAQIKSTLDAAQQRKIIEQAQALAARQLQQDDESVLPKVDLSDVPPDVRSWPSHSVSIKDYALTIYHQGTNGLIYQQLVVQLPKLEPDLLEILPLFSGFLTELGCGDQDYLQIQNRQSAVTGGLHAYTEVRNAVGTMASSHGFFVLSGKALVRNQDQLTALMQQTFLAPKFDELKRIRELVSQSRLYREQSVTGSGHSLAMSAASSGYSPLAFYQFKQHGLHSIQMLQQLDDALNDNSQLTLLAEKFSRLHQQLLQAPRQFLLVTEEEHAQACCRSLDAHWMSVTNGLSQERLQLSEGPGPQQQIWVAESQVNFCASAFATVPVEHADAPALTVLGGFLRNGYLHRAIRETGGAYGGGASQDGATGTFRFYSYRDPRLLETLADFEASLRWLHNTKHAWQPVEEAILGVIGALDKPSSPAGEAKKAFHNELHGRNRAYRQRFREGVLAVTQEDLLRVATAYLQPSMASRVVIGGEQTAEVLQSQGYEKFKL